MDEKAAYSQEPFLLRLDWGDVAAETAAARGDIVVIVDTLEFSTAVTVAISNGAKIYPAKDEETGKKIAERVGAELAHEDKKKAIKEHGFSLSPNMMTKAKRDQRIVLPSPNGAFDSKNAVDAHHLFVGTFVNVSAIASAVRKVLETEPHPCTVIACGELLQHDHQFRPAIEDYLAAGAILDSIGMHHALSPEARVCEAAWRQLKHEWCNIIKDSGSARKIIQDGFPEDVDYACSFDKHDVVPIFREDHFEALETSTKENRKIA